MMLIALIIGMIFLLIIERITINIGEKYRINNTEFAIVTLAAVVYSIHSWIPLVDPQGERLNLNFITRMGLMGFVFGLLTWEAKQTRLNKVTLPVLAPVGVGGNAVGNSSDKESTTDKINNWLDKRSKTQKIALFGCPTVFILSTILEGFILAAINVANFIIIAWLIGVLSRWKSSMMMK